MATAAELIAFIKECTVTGTEADSLVQRAQDPDYWLSLSPAMTITTDQPEISSNACHSDLTGAIDDYNTYGHTAIHNVFAVGEIESLGTAVNSVSEAGWPLIFAFVYDGLWNVGRTTKLRAFVSRLIGSEYQPTISFWVNHVPATRGGSGFPPHMDDVWAGHHTVTCWVPLTPVSPDNGCVYVIERNAESPNGSIDLGGANLTAAQVLNALPRVRALPAGPGSFLAWPNDTIHWGGMYMRGQQARTALSFHFADRNFENVDPSLSESMLIDRPLPRFEDRLRWVSQSMLRFRGRDPLLERFAPVAHRLIKECGGSLVNDHLPISNTY